MSVSGGKYYSHYDIIDGNEMLWWEEFYMHTENSYNSQPSVTLHLTWNVCHVLTRRPPLPSPFWRKILSSGSKNGNGWSIYQLFPAWQMKCHPSSCGFWLVAVPAWKLCCRHDERLLLSCVPFVNLLLLFSVLLRRKHAFKKSEDFAIKRKSGLFDWRPYAWDSEAKEIIAIPLHCFKTKLATTARIKWHRNFQSTVTLSFSIYGDSIAAD